MGEYKLTKGADADLLEMFLYGFEAFGAARAEDYREGMGRCFQLLADQPGIGRPAKGLGPGVRRHEHAWHVIFYEEAPGGVLILGIVHERSVRRLKP